MSASTKYSYTVLRCVHVGVTGARHGCDFTATFDRGMRKLPGIRVL